MAIDHCFQIKGSGTVFTGTVLSGQIALNDQVEVVSFSETKKVKSIQIFRQAQKQAKAGDRAAICVTQFDAAKGKMIYSLKKKGVWNFACLFLRFLNF